MVIKNRKIYYDIDYVGENVRYCRKKKYLNLQLENIKQKWILILIKFKDIMYNPKLSFFTENVFFIQDERLAENEKGYVVLAAVKHDNKFITNGESFSYSEILLAKKFLYNQSNGNKKNCHFDTSGTIHSFGYGLMYHQDPLTRHSFAKFSTSKFFLF